MSLSEEDPLAGAPRGDESTKKIGTSQRWLFQEESTKKIDTARHDRVHH